MTFKLHLSPMAEADIDDILLTSFNRFGLSVSEGYEALIGTTFQYIVTDPERPGTHPQPELGRGIRHVHLRTTRDRVRGEDRRIIAPTHIIFYRLIGDTVHVSRILHEARSFAEQHFP